MAGFYNATVLVGGNLDCLDAIDGLTLASGDCALVVIDDRFLVYQLTLSGTDESVPDVIEPDLNSSMKRWELIFDTGAVIAEVTQVFVEQDIPQNLRIGYSDDLIYDILMRDTLNEFNIGTSRFMPKTSGNYLINFAIQSDYVLIPTGGYIVINLYGDYSLFAVLDRFYGNGVTSRHQYKVSKVQYLTAGVEYYIKTFCYALGDNFVTSGDSDSNYIQYSRLVG